MLNLSKSVRVVRKRDAGRARGHAKEFVEVKAFIFVRFRPVGIKNGHQVYAVPAAQKVSSRNERGSTIVTLSREADWLVGLFGWGHFCSGATKDQVVICGCGRVADASVSCRFRTLGKYF